MQLIPLPLTDDCSFCAFQQRREPLPGRCLALCARHAAAWQQLNDVALQETLPLYPRPDHTKQSAAQRLRSISRNGA